MTEDQLRAYSDAWNDHDIDRIMSFMTEHCVFETGGGSERYGTRFEGYTAVRERFIEVWTDIPDASLRGTRALRSRRQRLLRVDVYGDLQGRLPN